MPLGGFHTETTLSVGPPSKQLVECPLWDPFEGKSVPSCQDDTVAVAAEDQLQLFKHTEFIAYYELKLNVSLKL